ncbi:hypothetical protein POF51_29785 [Brevibacillus sp. AG]|uniref:hypothetical protein n=1 Tax=Brevibacillus sp. AG TaxID=3020891 RepID=UPI00232BB126|nr:hypothetical protein [Brevibacillus sp. AG]MDC0764916.1 hypothetical protein [Brevibacillus sp. AG]
MPVIRNIPAIRYDHVADMLNIPFHIRFEPDHETIVLVNEEGNVADVDFMKRIGQYLIQAADKIEAVNIMDLYEKDLVAAEIRQRLFNPRKGRWYVYCDNCRVRLDSHTDSSYFTLSIPYKRHSEVTWTRHCSEECAKIFTEKCKTLKPL